MKSRYLFLLVYLVGATTGNSRAQGTTTCGAESCGQEADATSRFLQCVGLPSTDTGKDHMQRLKVMLEATMDVYTFMKSSMTGVPVLSLEGALNFNPGADPLQNEALVQMWLEVKIKPLLGSITKHFLSCLSTKNFSCSTYQTVVGELSQYFSEMNPVRQKWIYTFFMYPFLSGERVTGCVNGNESSEEWLMKNFGAFRAMARMKDFTSLNMVFSGLEVLHLLSPAQKAELLLKPEVAGLDNGTLTLVFNSLLPGQQTIPSPGNSSVVPVGYSSPHSTLKEIANGFMTAFRPIGSFAHEFVSFTRQRNVSEIKSTTLTQFLLNWTLAELADVYEPPMVPDIPEFDVTNVDDWYQQVVLPLLRRFLPNDENLMHQNITLAFHELYFLEHGGENEYDELQDVCSVTLDKSPCGLTDAVENVAHIMHCAAKSELTMTEETIMRLITELAERLHLLIKEFTTTNFAGLASDIKEIFNENEPPTLTQHHLDNPEFIKLWYQIKLLPLLPDVNPDLLSCLSTKNFSCPVYQTLVAALGESMRQMDADMMYSHNIYRYFIYSFLNHNATEPQCISSANQSAEWVNLNFGFFSSFASVIDFYQLNPNFSALEALQVLTPKQLAEMLLLPLPGPTDKDTVINAVFDFLLESPEDRTFTDVLHFVVQLAEEANPPCSVYQLIFERMYGALTMIPPDLEPVIWARIDDLMGIAPAECVPAEVTCQDTQINRTLICQSINSSVLQSYLNDHAPVSCSFTLEEYACAQLEDFTAEQLASLMRCNLPGNGSHSRVLWKLLLTKLSSVLNPALDMLANTSVGMIPSAEEILDVIEEIRLSALTDGELADSGVIHLWFTERLSVFLPFASGRFLLCLTSRNLSCPSYQQILQVFVGHFEEMPFQQQLVVLKDFILRFLLNAHSGPGCLPSFNNSAQWLTDNFGPFSQFVIISDLIRLNPLFKPLEALHLLTPNQTAELLGLTLPESTDAVINMIFDYMTEAPEERRFTEFLSSLVMISKMLNLSCSSYKTLFTRLDDAMATASSDVASAITYTEVALFKRLPSDCIIYSGQCNVTMANETDICMGVNSTELQILLDRSTMAERHCSFSVEEFACASLSSLTAGDLADMLGCDRVSDSSGSKPAWKLLLSKASKVLDQALDLLSNTTLRPDHPSAPMILDSIRELRLLVVNMTVLNDPAFVQMWFGRRLRPFLPAVSSDFLSCLATESLDCSTYHYIVKTFSELQSVMLKERQLSVLTHFITGFLTTNNTADPRCLPSFNNSAQWLTDNFGPFSQFAIISDLIRLNPLFKPFDVIQLLTPDQRVELLGLTLPESTDAVINMLFDYMTEAPEERKFTEFLSSLVMFTKMLNLSCSSYKTLFTRLDITMATTSPDIVLAITNTKLSLSKQLPLDCIIYSGQCNVTMANETDICMGVNSTELQILLDRSTMAERHCSFSVEEFACASLSGLTARDLAAMLRCDRVSDSSGSKAAWKLLLSKASKVLDQALDLLSNTTLRPDHPSAPMILDSIRELRLLVVNMTVLNDPAFVQMWFGRRLRPFLPAVSNDFLSCLATESLDCSTYHYIVKTFSELQSVMLKERQLSVLTHFITGFLTTNNTAGPGCLSSFNNSAQWLTDNFGPFSQFVPISVLIQLNPLFKPLEAFQLLTPDQRVELLGLTLPENKDVVINMLFDYMIVAPERSFVEFLLSFVRFTEMGSLFLSCSSYKTLFTRLDDAMATATSDLVSAITYTKVALFKRLPSDCIIYSGQCNVTMANETDICMGVNSTELQILLDRSTMAERHCSFSVEEFACASLSSLTAGNLADMLGCDRVSDSSGSKPAWKLLLSKASKVLDQALDLLSNTTLRPDHPSAPMILDSIRELRLLVVNMTVLNDPAFVQMWFGRRLRPFLPAVSSDFLSCLATESLDCSTYQYIVKTFSELQSVMLKERQLSVLTHFITGFLTTNNTADPRCLPSFNNSAQWLTDNFGPFSQFAIISDLIRLNPLFKPFDVIQLLTPDQRVELLGLTLPESTDAVINMLFDYMTEAPEERKFTEFLSSLVMFTKMLNLSCSSYKTLFTRLDITMATTSPDIVLAITNTKLSLSKQLPLDCIIYSGQCNVTMANETDICTGVNSTELQILLDRSTMAERHCSFSVEEFACASLSGLTARDLADMLGCDRVSDSSGSKAAWKLLLSKASKVLDQALDLLSNTTLRPDHPSAPMILDSIRELRLLVVNMTVLNDPAFVQMWFGRRLRPFLPAVSSDFLSCLATESLDCSTYQYIVKTFSELQSVMLKERQLSVLTHFITGFLTNNTAGPGCLSSFNNSAQWLTDNFGPFSQFVPISVLIQLNPLFKPLEAFQLLTPDQRVELLGLTLPENKDVVINMLFDYMIVAPERSFVEFLLSFVRFTEMGSLFLSCSSYKTLFTRLDDAMATATSDLVSAITYTKVALFKRLPSDCIIYSGQCNETMTNETDICMGVNSTELQILLDRSTMAERHCSFSVEEFACASLSSLTAGNLADMLGCDRVSDSSGSKPAWKLLLSNASKVLDQALDLLSNTTLRPDHPSAPMILDSIRELRLLVVNMTVLNDPAFVQMWFGRRLRPFLPAVSSDFLSCLATESLDCSTYHYIVKTFSELQSVMLKERQLSVLTHFITGFLTTNNTADPRCLPSFNNSAQWLTDNFGPFSQFAIISDLIRLNPLFKPFDVIQLLTPDQRVELLGLTLPESTDAVINMLFDYMTEAPEERKFTEFLSSLVMFTKMLNLSCSSYKTLFTRLDITMATTSPDIVLAITNTKLSLSKQLPLDCIIYSGQCNVTMANETDICMGVNSTELQILLDRSTMAERHCSFSVEEFACASLSGLTARDLADMLGCDRVSDSSGSKAAWKLLLSKASKVLDQALDLLSNTTLRPDHPSAPMILDSIRELRLLVVNMTVLNDPAFVQMWFGRRLRPFLPAVSSDFLSCLATESLDCSTYQYIVKTFSELQSVMLKERQLSVLTHFITGFLTNNTAGPGCLSLFNNSAQWLTDNFGPFSQFVPISVLIQLNPLFKPLEAFQLLTPDQRVELLGLTLPENKDVVINMLFDYMIVAPERSFVEFLLSFVRFTEMGSLFLSCSSYKTLFTRLDDAMATATSDLVSAITYTKVALFKRLPSDCIIYSGQCNETMTNETDICMGVNSTELQILLDRSTMAERHCSFSVEEFACASLSSLTAGNLADMLGCDRVSDSSGSKPAWKLLLSKASKVLDQALDLLSNTTLRPDHPSAPMILDSIRELRLLVVNMTVLNDPAFVQMWFGRRLRPFLPAVSSDFLSCLATESLDCSTYQYIVKTFSELQSVMLKERQLSVLTHFITGFLTTNNTADPRCLPSFNNSAQWLTDNFGPFSQFAIISDLIRLNPLFKPFDVIQLLTPDQRVELLGLTLPESTDAVINMLFDYMTEAPEERKFTEFLSSLVMFTKMLNLSCSSYKTLFTRLDITMATTSPDIVLAITNTKLSLSKQLPLDCIIYSGQCNVTMANETDICMGVNSTELQILLDRPTMAERHCSFSVEEFACASLSGLTARDLADMLGCDRVSDSSGSKAAWKLLLSKASKVLDQALDLLSNTTLRPDHPSAPMILDSIRELRLLVVNMTVLNDPAFVQMWFGRRLRPFLPAVSSDFLSCLATESLDCSTYQYIVKTFSELQSVMLKERQLSVLTHFITGFLTNNTAGPGCLSLFNNSAQWLTDNFGPFSQFVPISVLIQLNPLFKPLEAFQLLTPDQRVELLGLTLPENKDVVINMLFDYMIVAPERSFVEFLLSFVRFTEMGSLFLSCSSYKTLFTRLDDAMATATSDLVSAITYTKVALFKRLPSDCIIYSGQCNETMTNETDICMGVNSTELQILLDRSTMAERHCSFSVEEFACASLSSLTAGNLADMLGCDRVSDSSGSKPAWKLLLSKASKVLDQALDLLSNTTLRPDHPSAPMILDSIRELRLLVVNMTVLNDPAFVQMWFGRRLRPFLPAVSSDFLSCLATESLDCSTYQYIVKTFSELQSVMLKERQLSVLTHFITGFLTTNNTADPRCLPSFNNSAQWLTDNFGPFSQFAIISDLIRLNPLFKPFDVIQLLTPDQRVELLGLTLPESTDAVINMLFDYMTEAPEERKFTEFLSSLVMFTKMLNLSCSSYKTLFTRLDITMATTSPDIVLAITNTKLSLSKQLPLDCIIYSGQCNVTMANETDICMGVNSTELQILLDRPTMAERHCSFSVEEFACASLSGLTARDLADMLGCDRVSDSSGSKAAWKLLLSKASKVLDQALDLLSNTTLRPDHPSAPMILDSIRELRLLVVNMTVLNDPAFVQMWFGRRLRPFLPAVSSDFLSCLATESLDCSTYQYIVKTFSELQSVMLKERQLSVLTHFITGFLTNNTAGPGCLSLFNNSAQWLTDNFGPFSQFVPISVLIQLNPLFKPLEAFQLLTPDQRVELLGLTLPENKDVVINMLFDYMIVAPERSFVEFLLSFVRFTEMGSLFLSCSSYKTLFTRLDDAMATATSDLVSAITYTKVALFKRLPSDCIIYSGQCNVTMTNETDICMGVNSTELQILLDRSTMAERHCSFSVEEFACASLSSLTAGNLADMLGCDRVSDSSGSKPAWKLLLSKASKVLDQALDLLSNTTLRPDHPSAPMILDSIRELRLLVVNMTVLNDPAFVQMWFGRRLRPFLPAVSSDFLSCLATESLDCSTYQYIVKTFSELQSVMLKERQLSVLTHFITGFLTTNNTADPRCLPSFNNSAQWLTDNFGPFSQFAIISDLIRLNPLFKPFDVIQLLTPDQRVELLGLTLPESTDAVINMLFDYMTEAPEERKFTEFLSSLVMFTKMLNLSCSSYKTLFTRLDITMATTSPDIVLAITNTKLSLSKQLPLDCIIYSGQCNETMTNETDICMGVNSTELQILLDRSTMAERHCSFSVEEFACASLSSLTAGDLADMLGCDRVSDSSGSKPAWKLLLSKASKVLDQALDLLSNTTLRPDHPSAPMILDSIRELRLLVVNMTVLNDPAFVQMWFGRRLRPFLPAVSSDFLSCLATESLDCSTYQYIVKTFSELRSVMLKERQLSVLTHFITGFLTTNNTADPACSSNTVSSGDWLQKNLGGFSVFLSIQELQKLYPNFSPMEALASLSVGQLVALSATPGLLTTPDQVAMVMKYVPDQMLAIFFDEFSVAIRGNEYMMPSAVRSAMLEVVFDRANLSHPSVEDSVVSVWLNNRLPPLVISLIPSQVNPYFQILVGRNCSIGHQGVTLLNSTIPTLTADSQKEIYNQIVLALKGPPALRCYGDGSFYRFVEDSFLGFQFPNLTTFLSLMPRDQKHLLVNSMPLSHLGNLLRGPGIVNNGAQLCDLYSSYAQTPAFLETESLPVDVRRPTLPCVWPMALSSTRRSEVNAWFDRSLQNYLVFLSKSLISPDVTHNTSCLAFQKLVSVLGQYNYTAVDFVQEDVFNTIRNYLQSETPRCYDPNNPELNSTAWFAEYIGPFMPFLTLEIFHTFGSDKSLQVFTVNPLNIALLNHSVLPQNLTNYYTGLVYQQDSNFNPLLLPLLCQCVAPGMAFTQLTPAESLIVLRNLTIVCQDLNPQISAALTSNFGNNIDSNTISALGNESTSMSTGQIKAINPQQLINALFALSNVNGWKAGQAKSIIESLITVMQINDSSSLFTLGTLIIGVPSRVFRKIQGSEILVASRNPSLVGHMMSAPNIVQQIFVTQILSVNSTGEVIIQNVPDEMATEIPRVFLQSFTAGSITKLNKKKWKRQQAEVFFGVIAVENATAVLGSVDSLSSSVLQGFTCTSVRTIEKEQVKKLVKACRRKGTDKVKLVESQLTCMFNRIKEEPDITRFDLFPPDVLLYYNYSLVSQSNCSFYFEQLSDADFSVFSSELSYKRTALFDNARNCLGITTTNLTKAQITVLGNMCCYLDASYILNSDESILEKLKTCPDLSAAQAAAVQTRLTGGTSRYRLASTWTETTLRNLDTFPLYMSSDFYDNFDKTTKRSFLKYYLKVLSTNGVSRAKIGAMKAEIRQSISSRLKRQTVTECTAGVITKVTIYNTTFPFDYPDVNQFNSCLSAAVVRDNLEVITQKVDQQDYLKIVLSKLQEAYSTTVPEDQVQVLGPASRVASADQINTWNITQVDTLASLMDTTNGALDPSLAKAIISKYLSVEGNKLERAELNAIGGPNLCSVNTEVLGNISRQSLREANALDVSNCTSDKLKVFFNIALQAFQTTTRASVASYQFIQPYLGGASIEFVKSLASSNINMDLQTFVKLDESVVQSLLVGEVKTLLGDNLPDLKSYENTPIVRSWISRQTQSELSTLNIGLTGGRADSSVSTNSTSSATTPSATTTTTVTTVKTTKGAGARIHGDVAGFTFFVFLALLVSSNQVSI